MLAGPTLDEVSIFRDVVVSDIIIIIHAVCVVIMNIHVCVGLFQ